ncbi:Ig-like domain-containing protein [Microbacterium aurugineum]
MAIFSDLGSVGAVTDNGDGSYTASFASTAAGLATLGFTINDATAAATALVTVNDTTPPLAPVIVVPTDGAVVSPLFAASGTGEPGANLTMSTGAITLCVTAVDPAGVWSCATAVALPTGPHTLVAVQEDVADNVSPESAAVMVTVDAEPPPPPVPSPTNGLTVSGTTLPGTTVTVRTDDGALVCTATAAPDSTFACVPPAPLEDGTLLRLIATDDAGNDSSEALVRVGGARVSLELTTAQPGQTQTAFGSGFLPGEDVTGLLESAPISLGLQTADADGAVTFIIALPGDIEVGEHTVTLTGTRSGAVAATFTVVLPPKVVDPPAVAPPVDNLPPVAGPGGLAGTGLALAALPALAILLLLSGSTLLITRRRSESA